MDCIWLAGMGQLTCLAPFNFPQDTLYALVVPVVPVLASAMLACM
jgi:hypothetical protein